MVSQDATQITTSARESNPKAVFVGGLHEIINPLALYLSANNVDLFSGNTFSDAFFGDYFFYVGAGTAVKKFLAANAGSLPKTLLLLVDDSEFADIEDIAKNHTQIKIVQLEAGIELKEKEAEKIIEFFFAGAQTVLNVREPGKKKLVFEPTASTSTGPSFVTEVLPEEANSTSEDSVEKKEPEKKTAEIVSAPVTQEPTPQPVAPKKNLPHKSAQYDLIADGPAIKTEPTKPLEAEIAHKNISADFTEEVSPESPVRRQVESIFDGDADPKQTGKSAKPEPKRKGAPLFLAAIIGLIIFVLFPVGAFAAQLGLASFYAFKGKEAFEVFDLAQSEKQFASAVFFSRGAAKSLGFTEGLFSILGQKNTFTQLRQILVVEEKLSQGGIYLAQAGQDGKTLLRGVWGQDRGVAYGQLITQAKGNLTLADTELAAAQAELKTAHAKTPFIAESVPFIGSQFAALPKFIVQAREKITTVRSVLALAPEVIGLYGEQTYLVLFQNNMELRPTGGFIGSFGLLTFADGAFKDFKVEDVYMADGALKGHIDPPPAISTHLKQEHWYLRDSNWDPDFSRSAARAMWFLDKELGVAVDGVIAVDLGFVQNMLQVMGPMEIADYDEKITADNLFLKSHTVVQSDFFPGSTQKRDFLGAVGRQLLSSLMNSPAEKQPALLTSIYTSFTEKHALVYFVSPVAQQVAQSLSWTGELTVPACQQSGCVADYAMVVDANLGVNKSNYFVTRSIHDAVNIQKDTIRHTLSIKYRNDSTTSDTQLGGYYKNYLRVVVPSQARLTSATVDAQPLQLEDGIVASASSVITEQIASFAAFATLIEVPPQGEKVVSLTYELPVSETEIHEYSLALRKQPGTTRDSLNVVITYPQEWTLIQSEKSGIGEVAGATTLVNNNRITYNSSLLTDQLLKAEFQVK